MADDKEPKEKKEAKPKGEGKSKGDGKAAGKTAEGKSSKKGKGKEAKESSASAIGEAEAPARVPRLREHYDQNVRAELMKRFSYSNPMQAPRLTKIVVNMGVGDALTNIKMLDTAAAELTTITGQKASIRKAKKSIANFKLREGNEIGAKVTLRGDRMWEFYDRLVSLAIPRIRDFRGMSPKQFDGSGNYTFGLTEQLVFPEIDYDRIDSVRGMDITIVTTAVTDDQGRALLRALGFPFRRDGQG